MYVCAVVHAWIMLLVLQQDISRNSCTRTSKKHAPSEELHVMAWHERRKLGCGHEKGPFHSYR